ncbi:unnamed protein product [Meganyctiphanes norvegica]|uniref:SERTA domain-containing protein n=1 Tax=Meganyctiphanes norvegica TaxID=48144 RepID=A0AAV2PH63_MEGNR
MVDLRKRVGGDSMAIDTNGVWPSNNNGRRTGHSSIRFRIREERKKVIRISSAKYCSIDDHETGLRRFCLIRNTLRRLRLEAREEKLARHRAGANNVSPSYLSASRPRSPSPPCDIQVAEMLSTYGQPSPSPITALSDDDDEQPPCKRPRLFMDDDKENENKLCEDKIIDVVGDKDEGDMYEPRAMDDTQEILREVYESYTGESLSQSHTLSPTHPTRPDTPYSTNCSSTANFCSNTSPSLNSNSLINKSCSSNLNNCSSNFSNGGFLGPSEHMEWSRSQQSYPCSHSANLGNDLQSVVFHSLMVSLES